MRHLLVTGGAGLLGQAIERTRPDGFETHSVHLRDYRVPDTSIVHQTLDIRNRQEIETLFERSRFDCVIHAAGISNVDEAQRNYLGALESNLLGTINVARACRDRGIHLVYVSTNAVFGGDRAPYRENDPVAPANSYGHIKVECERLVRESVEACTIVRPILMYGWNRPTSRPNPVTWLVDRLERGEITHLVDDVRENPLFSLQAGRALWRIVEDRPAGIFHLAGAGVVNRYELGLAVARTFDLDPGLLRRVDSSFFPEIAPRPKNTSFVTERMEQELGVAPVSLEEGLGAMRATRSRER